VVKKFVEYVELVIKEFGEYIDYAVVINEPQIYALNAYLGALSPDNAFPPFTTMWEKRYNASAK
jgi:beta-glucosidase/6-phospho-beta-glucosidase/beta-galactosidase